MFLFVKKELMIFDNTILRDMESWPYAVYKQSDMIKLSKATGGRVVSNLDDLSENDLGVAELAHQKKVESD